jgi:hypothetical protein
MVLSAPAWAQLEDEPAPVGVPAALPPIPDASYRAVLDRTVILRTRGGGEVTGRILAFDPATVSMAVAPSQSVITFDRMEIVGMRLEPPPLPPPLVAPPPAQASSEALQLTSGKPPRERHAGLHLGLAPSIYLDLDYKLFYGFFNASLVLPAATSGDLAGFSLGAGLNFPITHGSAWKFEVFTYLASAKLAPDWAVGIGVGIGLHYTFRSGFAVGFKAPILGYAFGQHLSSGSDGVAIYYLASAMGMPLLSLGYRF